MADYGKGNSSIAVALYQAALGIFLAPGNSLFKCASGKSAPLRGVGSDLGAFDTVESGFVA